MAATPAQILEIQDFTGSGFYAEYVTAYTVAAVDAKIDAGKTTYQTALAILDRLCRDKASVGATAGPIVETNVVDATTKYATTATSALTSACDVAASLRADAVTQNAFISAPIMAELPEPECGC